MRDARGLLRGHGSQHVRGRADAPGAQVIYDFGDEKILEATDKTLEAVAEAALLDSEKQAFVEKALVYAEGRRVLGKVSSFQEAFTPKKGPPT